MERGPPVGDKKGEMNALPNDTVYWPKMVVFTPIQSLTFVESEAIDSLQIMEQGLYVARVPHVMIDRGFVA